MSRVAVFLDRDGVLNRDRPGPSSASRPPWTLDEFELLPLVGEACDALRALGFVLVVVTNQPDVARGLLARAALDRINAELVRRVSVDAVRVCCHDDSDRCSCRKPAPGMLVGAAAEMDIDLGRSFMVGDRWRDIEAGRAAGCRTIFVGESAVELPSPADYHARSLFEAADWIRQQVGDPVR